MAKKHFDSQEQKSTKDRFPKGSIDSFDIYSKDVAKHRVISAAEEKRLGEIIQRGLLASETLDSREGKKKLTKKQRDNLQREVIEGQDAEEELSLANLRLVISIAKNYQRGGRYEMKDLIQCGNLGLLHAVRKFDPTKGFKFSTYATWWIRQSIVRSLPQQEGIHAPSRVLEEQAFVLYVREDMASSLGRAPSVAELSEEIGVPEEKIHKLLSLDTRPILFSLPVSYAPDGSKETLGDTITSSVENQYVVIENNIVMKDAVRKILSQLDPQGKKILELFYGIDNDRAYTVEEISRRENISVDSVKSILAKAKRKIVGTSSNAEIANGALTD